MPLSYDGLCTWIGDPANAPGVNPHDAPYVDYTEIPSTSAAPKRTGIGFLVVVGIVAAILIFSKR